VTTVCGDGKGVAEAIGMAPNPGELFRLATFAGRKERRPPTADQPIIFLIRKKISVNCRRDNLRN